MPKIYTNNFPIFHRNKWYTDSACFWFLVCMLTLTLPMLLAIATNGFIRLESIQYDQPNVKFTNEMIVEALVNDGTVDQVYQYSTIQDLNNKFTRQLTAPSLSVNNIDHNTDNLNENIDIDFKFTTTAAETVKSVHILMYLQYYVGDEINTQLKTMVYKELNAAQGQGLTYARMKGPLRLEQKNPLAPGTMKREVYNTALEDDFESYGISGIVDMFQLRNQTVEFEADPLISSFGSSTQTKITMDMEIPTIESISYYPSVLEVLKNTWIQYLAFFIPIYFVLYIFMYGFVVKSNVLN